MAGVLDLGGGLEKLEAEKHRRELERVEGALAHLSSFAVRLELIHTLLSHEVAVSFRSFASESVSLSKVTRKPSST